jgi:hypothetical protein
LITYSKTPEKSLILITGWIPKRKNPHPTVIIKKTEITSQHRFALTQQREECNLWEQDDSLATGFDIEMLEMGIRNVQRNAMPMQ